VSTMRAAVLVEPGQFRIEDVPVPRRPNQALIRVREVGICGTDLKILTGGAAVDYPRILGHEMVGEILEPGETGRFAEGDRVLLDPSVSCGFCARCRRDNGHLCGSGGLMGRDSDGVFAQRVSVPESQLLPVPDGIPWEHGPMLQIAGTCVHGQELVDAGPGQVAVVVGLGVSGLLQVQLLKARGVDRIVGITRSESKLRLAEQLGATHTAQPADANELVATLTDGEGADLVIEASGALAGLRTSVEVARPAAQILAFGTISATEGEFPYYQLYAKEIDLVSSRAALPRDYAAAIDHVARGRIVVEPLLSERFTLEQAPQAIAAFRDDPGVLKVTMSVDD
jgi:L-iditol 2-dehydrogenase